MKGGVILHTQIILKQHFADYRYAVGCYFRSILHGSTVINKRVHDSAHLNGRFSCFRMKLQYPKHDISIPDKSRRRKRSSELETSLPL
jgi:hypothetical protein